MTAFCAILCLAAAPAPAAWDGFDLFFTVLELEGVTLRENPRTDCIVVIGEAPAARVCAEIQQAVRDGATLCIASESASARPLLSRFSLQLAGDVFLTFNPFAVFKGQFDCPVISDLAARVALFDDVKALATNRARALSGAGTPLAFFPATGEQRPAFMREVREGRGRVIAIGDQSIFINLMLPERDNERFLRNLVGTTRTGIVYIRGQRCAHAHEAAGDMPPLPGRIPIPDLAPNVEDVNALLADLQGTAPVETLNAQAFPVLCGILALVVVWTFLRCILSVWLPPRKPFGAPAVRADTSAALAAQRLALAAPPEHRNRLARLAAECGAARGLARFVKELSAAGRGSAASSPEKITHAHRQ